MSERKHYGRLADLPDETADIARSVEQAERATDRVMAGLANVVSEATAARQRYDESGNPLPLTEEDREAVLRDVDAALLMTYGSGPDTADRGELGSVIVAECHNTRKRAAATFLREHVAPALRRDAELRRRMGIDPEELR